VHPAGNQDILDVVPLNAHLIGAGKGILERKGKKNPPSNK